MRRFFIPVGLAAAAIYVMRVLFGPSGEAVENSGVHAEIVERPVTPPSVQPPAQKETAALEASAPDAQDTKAEQGAPSKPEPATAKEATAALEAPAPDTQDTKVEQGARSAEPATAKEAPVDATKKVEQPKKPRTRRAEAQKKEASAVTPKRKASSRTRKANRTAKRRLPPHEAYLWDRAYPPPYIERRYLVPLRRHYYWREYEYY